MTDTSESLRSEPPPGYGTTSAGDADQIHHEDSKPEPSEPAPSTHSFPKGYESQLDLLQRRLNTKTRRVVRAIQFNLLAVTALVGIIEFAAPPDFAISGVFLLGGGLLMLSGVCSFIGVTLNSTQLPLTDAQSGFSPTEVAEVYRHRNQILGKLMPLALVAGGLGTILLILEVLRIASIERSALPLDIVFLIVTISLLGAVGVGRYLATGRGERP